MMTLRGIRFRESLWIFVVGGQKQLTKVFSCTLQSKQVKRSSHEWINKFIIANLISVIISIICSSDE